MKFIKSSRCLWINIHLTFFITISIERKDNPQRPRWFFYFRSPKRGTHEAILVIMVVKTWGTPDSLCLVARLNGRKFIDGLQKRCMLPCQALDHVEVFVQIKLHQLAELLIHFPFMHHFEEVLVLLAVTGIASCEHILLAFKLLCEAYSFPMTPHLLGLFLSFLEVAQMPFPDLTAVWFDASQCVHWLRKFFLLLLDLIL